MNLWKRSSSSFQHDKSLISKARISLMKKNIHLSRKNVLLNSPSNTYRNESEVCGELLQRSRNEMFLEHAVMKHRKEKEDELKQINQIRKILVKDKIRVYHNLHLNNPFDSDREFYESIKNKMISINKREGWIYKKKGSVSLPVINAHTEVVRSPMKGNYNYNYSKAKSNNVLKKKIKSLKDFPIESKEYKLHVLIKRIHGLNEDINNKQRNVVFKAKHSYK